MRNKSLKRLVLGLRKREWNIKKKRKERRRARLLSAYRQKTQSKKKFCHLRDWSLKKHAFSFCFFCFFCFFMPVYYSQRLASDGALHLVCAYSPCQKYLSQRLRREASRSNIYARCVTLYELSHFSVSSWLYNR